MNDLGKYIKQKREELGLSQEELARILGYKHKSSINKIELGLVDVPRAKLPAFASALGVSPAQLSGWKDEDHQETSFHYCLEHQMRICGYTILYSADGDVILTHEGAGYEITELDIINLEKSVRSYIEHILYDLTSRSRKIGV